MPSIPTILNPDPAGLQRHGTYGAASPTLVNMEVFSSVPFSLTENGNAVPHPSVSTPTLARFAAEVAPLLAVLVFIFLLVRCVYHIPTTNAYRTTKGRRMSDHPWENPCQPERQPGQEQGQDVPGAPAGAVAAPPAGAASISSGEGPAAPPRPKQNFPAGYSPPFHLDLMTLYTRSSGLNAWIISAELAEHNISKGEAVSTSDFEELLREAVDLLKDLKLIVFSKEVSDQERQSFINTLTQSTQLAKRLAERMKDHWAKSCNSQVHLLKSSFARAHDHMQRMLGGHVLQPSDPAILALVELRKALNDAKKVYDGIDNILSATRGLSTLGSSLGTLSKEIKEAEASLQQAVDACAGSWTRHLTDLNQQMQVGGSDERARQRLLDGMQTAKKVQEKLHIISGRALSM